MAQCSAADSTSHGATLVLLRHLLQLLPASAATCMSSSKILQLLRTELARHGVAA